MLTIGTIPIDNPFLQAALSGYSDYPMRHLARRFGCALTLTGVMLDRIALHPKAIKQTKFHCGDDEHPIGAQIFGDQPDVLAQSAAVFQALGYDLIDLNFACPVPKVLRRQRGGWLMGKPSIVREAFRRTRDAVTCPVTIKLRIGLNHSDAALGDFWEIVENAAADGVDAISIHGRTVEQRYKGKADWSVIADVKRRFPTVRIFGSGDLMDAPTAIGRMQETGVDGVLFARGAVGNPWIFEQAIALWKGRTPPPPPTPTQQAQVMFDHLEMIQRVKPGRMGLSLFRKFAAGYCRLHPQRRKALCDFMTLKTMPEFQAAMTHWYGV